MPNFKIIQDQPDQARVKIYGSNNAAINQDTSGNIGITNAGNPLSITTASGQALAITTLSGQDLAITNAGNPLSITTASGQALAITTLSGQNLAITNAGNPLSITTASGQALAITTLSGQPLQVVGALSTTDVTFTTGDFANTDDALTTPTRTVLDLAKYSWLISNTASGAGALAQAKLEGSPDGVVWLDNSSFVTVTQNTVIALVPTYFLKYARVYYSGTGNTSASLSIFLQGQS